MTKKGLLKLPWGVAKNKPWHLEWKQLFVLLGLQQGQISSFVSSGNECPFPALFPEFHYWYSLFPRHQTTTYYSIYYIK